MEDDLSQKYRHVFTSSIGREVLVDILANCHFGETLDAENLHKIAEYNVGIYILSRCGIFGPDRDMAVINALINSLTSSKSKKEDK